jgi:acyl-CoA hydrolase
MKSLAMVLCLTLAALVAKEAWAKRTAPKPVTPAIHHGVKYVALNANGREGKIEARDEKTGEKLWQTVIYTVKIDPGLEEDVQWVFITSLAVRDETLLVTNEKNEQYILDLGTKKVEKVKPGSIDGR